jgi:hypothetical protein
LDVRRQAGRVAFDNVPHFLHVHPVVGVNENIAKSGDFSPGNLGVLGA